MTVYIGVDFHARQQTLSYLTTLPNGPTWTTGNFGGKAYGLGFTFAGAITDGSVGKIGAEPNPDNPKGQWTMDQWIEDYVKINRHEF
jgi:hypothetical protein